MNRPARLYRWFDSEDRLLYVGISSQPRVRARQHIKSAAWVHLATRMEIDPVAYESRQAALEAEAKAIATEKPIYNIIYQPPAPPSPPPVTDKRRPGRPEIGNRVTIAIGDLLSRIDAARGHATRASWLRSAAEHALTCPDPARTAKPDTEETPAMTVDREQLDHATAASLARGLAQSAAGQTVDLGDFTQYADDTEETQR